MPSKLQRAIGAVKDQTSISLAKVSSGATTSNLEVAVLKATTHDDVPIDEKYVHEVLKLVSSNKFHAAACARAVGKRIGRTRNWIVALKSLMLVLRIFQDGDPYFPREVLIAMKRGAKILNLSSFRDDSNSSPWDFTSFVRTFALYLDERLECFLTGKLQRRYTHEAKENWFANQRAKSRVRRDHEPVREMKPAMLLDKISFWQRLLDRAIATRPTGAARSSRLVQVSLYAIVEESFELYKDISDGLTLVLDSFFHLQFQNCVSAFQACAKAAKQFRELSHFYSLCKSIGVGRTSEYPSVQTISEELIEALQEFLKDQNSFPSNAKPAKRCAIPPPSGPRQDGGGEQSDLSDKRSNSLCAQSPEQGSQSCTSLEELINATETGTCPAISIDLEAYPATQQDEAFRISDTCSTRSLPVTNSMADLMSIWDWSEQDDDYKEPQEGALVVAGSSPASTNWEIVLAEALTTTKTTTSPSPQPISDKDETNHPTAGGSINNSWELVLAEAAPPPPPQQPHTQQERLPNNNVVMPPSNHYNPFLQDEIEISNMAGTATLTFHAIPPLSMQNPNQRSFENDPFADANWPAASFSSSDPVLSGSVDQQNLLHEQQLWLINQNKIIAKNMT